MAVQLKNKTTDDDKVELEEQSTMAEQNLEIIAEAQHASQGVSSDSLWGEWRSLNERLQQIDLRVSTDCPPDEARVIVEIKSLRDKVHDQMRHQINVEENSLIMVMLLDHEEQFVHQRIDTWEIMRHASVPHDRRIYEEMVRRAKFAIHAPDSSFLGGSVSQIISNETGHYDASDLMDELVTAEPQLRLSVFGYGGLFSTTDEDMAHHNWRRSQEIRNFNEAGPKVIAHIQERIAELRAWKFLGDVEGGHEPDNPAIYEWVRNVQPEDQLEYQALIKCLAACVPLFDLDQYVIMAEVGLDGLTTI